jgi:ATP-dependent helicase/nuclease subunit B
VRARFLLGPAGGGKTYRCLQEVRRALMAAPEGLPLLFLTPKQATFQLERQLLALPGVEGYTRLFILSFERLAHYVLSISHQSAPECVDDQGRLMVLQALLIRHGQKLRYFQSSTRKPGFVSELSRCLLEFQTGGFPVQKFRENPGRFSLSGRLRDKIHDLLLVSDWYTEWLHHHQLTDSSLLLQTAADALHSRLLLKGAEGGSPRIGQLWMDGFAQLTKQEIELLAAILPVCGEATLAFCLESEPDEDLHWLARDASVGQCYHRVRNRLSAVPEIEMAVEPIPRNPAQSRFALQPSLAHLETWLFHSGLRINHESSVKPVAESQPISCRSEVLASRSVAGPEDTVQPGQRDDRSESGPSVRLVSCYAPDAEARLAAEEVLRHVHAGGRYRDVAILVRRLEGYQDVIRREFVKHGIPFFLDQREPVSHHPLAELTRCALRTVVHNWRHADWFGALKTGLASTEDLEVDQLENEAMAKGWKGDDWMRLVLSDSNEATEGSLQKSRRQLVAPFARLAKALSADSGISDTTLTGPQFVGALRNFWLELGVPERLEKWSAAEGSTAWHTGVWNQMSAWLEMVSLAFSEDALPLTTWMTITDTALSSLTVGLVPPALDQVLVGGIDRSRNPDLQVVIVLGMNESVFPAPPMTSQLLSDWERRDLADAGISDLVDRRQNLSQERYLGYIACTRARQRLIIAWAERSTNGETLNPSPFVGSVRNVLPGVEAETYSGNRPWWEARSRPDLVAHALRIISERRVAGKDEAELVRRLQLEPDLREVLSRFEQFQLAQGSERLATTTLMAYYGHRLEASVRAWEQYAACPFQFFVSTMLRGKERAELRADPRNAGQLAHSILKEFHNCLARDSKRWRDVRPEDARRLVGEVARDHMPVFAHGLFQEDVRARFQFGALVSRLQDLVEAMVRWNEQNAFDPMAAELGFGVGDCRLPGWELELGKGYVLVVRGVVDRVDLYQDPSGSSGYYAVVDYKLGSKTPDMVLVTHGIEMQPFAYLAALEDPRLSQGLFPSPLPRPAGAFYISLRTSPQNAAHRDDALMIGEGSEAPPFQHRGRFRFDALRIFDRRPEATMGHQYRYRLKKDGTPWQRGCDVMEPGDFQKLVTTVRQQLVKSGQLLMAGRIAVEPFRKGSHRACDFCEYQSICRFDPWIQPFRLLSQESLENDG